MKTAILGYEKNPQWDYMPPGEWLAAIHKWNFTIGAGEKEKRSKNHPFCLARDIVGTEREYLQAEVPVPWFDRADRMKSAYPARMICETEFELEKSAGKEKILLVCENDTFQGDCRILINGKELKRLSLRRKTIYDPFNLSAEVSSLLKSGKNKISIEWPSAGEFDGLKSSIYFKVP